MHKLFPYLGAEKTNVIKEFKKKKNPTTSILSWRIRNIQKKNIKTVKICYPVSRWTTDRQEDKIPQEQTSLCTHKVSQILQITLGKKAHLEFIDAKMAETMKPNFTEQD